mmetsp:Transcript_71023/g.162852  ORF Transcript_71023/g.162852 Transcript_71023/m.162852 type:complete len:85 (-) Transcript_71023:277-531(-)
MFTICELDRYGRVKKHTDHWSVASLLESIPILSMLYKTSRYVCGTMFSKTVNGVSAVPGLASLMKRKLVAGDEKKKESKDLVVK